MNTPGQGALERAVAAEVRAAIARRGMTQRAAQEATGIPESTWRNYFVHSRNAIPLSVLFQVCEALGVEPSDLLADAQREVRRQHGASQPNGGLSSGNPALG